MSAPPAPVKISFGTDGWRAVIAEGFTFANLERVAQAYADSLTQITSAASSSSITGERTTEAQADHAWPANMLTVVGYDRRFLSEQFARRAAEVLAGNSFQVALFDEAVPTPLISWAVREQRALGGVVITASHNPAEFNGFKIKAPWGGSASPDMTAAVESMLDQRATRRAEVSVAGTRELLQSTVESYRAQIASYIDLERLRRARGRVVVDSMHGAGAFLGDKSSLTDYTQTGGAAR